MENKFGQATYFCGFQNSELLLTVTELTQQLEMSRHVEKKGGGNSVRRRRGQSNDDDDFDTDADDSVVVDAEEEGVDDDEHDWENVEFGRKAGGGKRRTKIGRIKTVVEDVD